MEAEIQHAIVVRRNEACKFRATLDGPLPDKEPGRRCYRGGSKNTHLPFATVAAAIALRVPP